jgi:hypothetical protein
MLIVIFAVIVILTWILVAMNVWTAVKQYEKDNNRIRLFSYMLALLITGSVIIGVSSAIVQRVIDSETYLLTDAPPSAVPYYRR